MHYTIENKPDPHKILAVLARIINEGSVSYAES